MSGTQTQSVEVRRVGATAAGPIVGRPEPGLATDSDTVLVEEPLEIHLDGELVATTMRTPGSDSELAIGLLWAEGRIAGPPARTFRCAGQGSPLAGPESVLCVQSMASGVDPDLPDVAVEVGAPSEVAGSILRQPATGAPRLGLTSSSCGVCGVEQIETLVFGLDPIPDESLAGVDVLAALELFASWEGQPRQGLFDLTGGSHAAAALDRSGAAIVVREDIGRHNAVDKVVGRLLLDGRLPGHGPASPVLLWVSGRASFEIIQKAWAAGFPAVAAVGAVSAMAIDVAERARMVLLGFARDGRATAYTRRAAEQVDRFHG